MKEPTMAAIPRKDILSRLTTMAAAGVPIIGGGAGTGLSAKAEEAGGIDLIIIYNSGRYRMAGRGSAAGLLALRKRQRDRQGNGGGGFARGPQYAGSGRGQRHRSLSC